jgi:hypothetical protein
MSHIQDRDVTELVPPEASLFGAWTQPSTWPSLGVCLSLESPVGLGPPSDFALV